MVNVVIETRVVLHVDTEIETFVEIFYRNIKSVSDKQTELSANVYYFDLGSSV